MNLVAGILHKALDGLNLGFPVAVMIIDSVFYFGHPVRESHVVEIDFVEAELANSLLGQFHIEFPNPAVEG